MDRLSPLDRAVVQAQALASPEPSKETRAIARNQLSSGGILMYLLRGYLIERDGKVASLAKQNFTTEEGVRTALKVQGEIVGLNRSIEGIFELAEEEFSQ